MRPRGLRTRGGAAPPERAAAATSRWAAGVARIGPLAGVALLVLSAAAAAGPAPPAGAEGVPPLTLEPCRLRGVEHAAMCGTLERPLDPARPDGRRIGIRVAVLPALARNKRGDAVFFFAGGPGQSAIELAGPVSQLLARLANRRDLVLIDQRGTGASATLACDDERTAGEPLRDANDPAAARERIARCRDELMRRPHGDLRRYTTTIAMHDADAVRRALGITRVNLVGVSYGTRAALEYLRLFPASVRRVVLDGVAPPDMALPASVALDAQAAFDALMSWCESDRSCAAAHPGLRQRWRTLLSTLPREVSLPDPVDGRPQALRLTASGLAALVRAPLYSPLLASALPLALSEAAAGRLGPLAGLAASVAGGSRGLSFSQGQHFSIVCSEDMPLAADAAMPADNDFAGATRELYRQVCRDWPAGEVEAAFRQVGPAAVPALLLSGAVDPVTPPRHARRVAASLGPMARHVEVPNAGHGLLALGCVRAMVHRFIDEPDDAAALAVDPRCVQSLPRPPLFRWPAAESPR